MMKRRSFLTMTAGTAALAGVGELGFFSRLPRVTAAEARLDSSRVRFHDSAEPIVRMLEDTPRERVLEEVAMRIRGGLAYRELLTGLLLAGVRNIQPRPVGFKFHAVMVVNSAHLASLASPDSDRWLPIFWAIDQFKSSQERDVREGDWTLGAVDEASVPPGHKAKQAFIEAMDAWDESAADAAMAGLARTANAQEIFEILSVYGARDFREIGHKEIYVANSFRTLEVIGWHHAEPVLRSLSYALLDRVGEKANPAKADLPADRPFRRNQELVAKIRSDWLGGAPDERATSQMLEAVREGSAKDASEKAVELLNRGAAPRSLFDAFFSGAAELVMRAPGILSLHAVTFTNALHYAWGRCNDEERRKQLLLQNAAFLPLFRGNSSGKRLEIDRLEPIAPNASGPAAVEEIFAEIGNDTIVAARKILSYLQTNPDPKPLADAARRLIFLKGRDAHDYKFSSAVLEDYNAMSSPWRERYLAASAFNLRGSSESENELVKRTRAALSG